MLKAAYLTPAIVYARIVRIHLIFLSGVLRFLRVTVCVSEGIRLVAQATRPHALTDGKCHQHEMYVSSKVESLLAQPPYSIGYLLIIKVIVA